MPRCWYEKRFIDPHILKDQIHVPPVFIIGHWRSGTTHLHNLLTRNPNAGYVTTYQSVFPHTMETKAGKKLFSWFMRAVIPPTRIADSMKLDPDLPEEEEFALGMGVPVSYYFFWLFPKKTNELLYLFPDSRFVFIHRNPLEVFPSTIRLQQKLLPRLEYHEVSARKIEDNILYVYQKIMNRYLEQRDLIPLGNLMEVRYEDLRSDPLNVIKRIYRQFNFSDQEAGLRETARYLKQNKGYKKNQLTITKEQKPRVEQELDFVFREWYR